MPEISVIIPAFNAEKTILETVNSVLSQTFQDLEILIINDGSTDNTLEVLSHIRDSRLTVFTFSNSGVSESRNRGIEKSSGRFLAFIDADDLWTPDKLADQLATLKRDPEVAVAYSWNDYIDGKGQFIRNGLHSNISGDVYEALFRQCFVENGSNILVKKKAVEAVGNFDASISLSEDWDFYLRLAEKFKFVCIPKVHVLYRQLPTSLSNRVLSMEKEGVKVLRNALLRSPERLKPYQKESFTCYYTYLFYKAFYQASSRKDWLIVLQILSRGIFYSPGMWNLIAKRRILRAVRGLVFNA